MPTCAWNNGRPIFTMSRTLAEPIRCGVENAPPSSGLKVGMISLGCAKNLVDAEIMLGSVLQRGMQITAKSDEADVLVVNTCAFIDSAKEESINAILEAHQQRGLAPKPGQKLIVSGCMSQRFSQELREQLPEVDAFIGLDQVKDLGAIIERVVAEGADPGFNSVARPTSRITTRRVFASRPRTAPTSKSRRVAIIPAASA